MSVLSAVLPTTSASSTRGRCATSAPSRRSRIPRTSSATNSSMPPPRGPWGWTDRAMKLSKSLLAGIAVVVLLVGGLGITLVSGHVFSSPTHQLEVTFPTADGMVDGCDVLEAGAKIGTNSDIEPTQDSSALVT